MKGKNVAKRRLRRHRLRGWLRSRRPCIRYNIPNWIRNSIFQSQLAYYYLMFRLSGADWTRHGLTIY